MKGARNHGPRSSAPNYCDHPTSSKALSQTIIETVQQMRNCLFGFVAHIGEAEGFSLNFAVAGIDHEVMLFSKSFRECRNVEFFSIVLHAGERFLRAGEHDVDAERVHVDLDARE